VLLLLLLLLVLVLSVLAARPLNDVLTLSSWREVNSHAHLAARTTLLKTQLCAMHRD
jgi:hypothetical protein